MLNWGQRIHTGVWFQLGVRIQWDSLRQGHPLNTVNGEADGDLEREKGVKAIGSMLIYKPSPFSSFGQPPDG